MKYIIILLGLGAQLLYGTNLFAQNAGIGTNNPNASAILDVQSNNKGVLFPKLSFGQMVGINNPENSLLVYLTSTDRFLYNKGTKAAPLWTRLETDADFEADNVWSLTGNSNINPANHYVGNAEPIDIRFRVNNTGVLAISASNHSLFLGHSAGNQLSNGIGNVAIGNAALQANINGDGLVAIGQNALQTHNANNGYNVAIGKNALRDCNTCRLSVAIGHEALANSNGAAVGNVAIGSNALEDATTNSRNTAVGRSALGYLNVGNNNVAIGALAGRTGNVPDEYSNMTFLGYGTSATDGISNSTAIGHEATVINSNSVVLGNTDVDQWIFGLHRPSASNKVLEVGNTFANGNGAYLATGGVWVNVSDVNKKQNIQPVNGQKLLQNLAALPVSQWRYKGSSDWHIGPMAQDFKALFNVGDDDKAITTVDAGGVALAVIQQLIVENELLEERINQLEKKWKH